MYRSFLEPGGTRGIWQRCLAALVLGALSPLLLAAGDVDHDRALHAASDPDNWLLHGRDYAEQRFSPLRQINRDTVARLGLAWSFDDQGNRALEATPIVVDGTMYVSGTWSVVHAIDARTGERLWSYDPQVARERARYLCCDVVNRGVAVWEGKVFIGTLDGRLLALDAATGGKLWETLTIDLSQPYSITGAPRVIDGRVIIGNGGAEYGVRGYVSAYSADTGDMLWRFYTVPGDPASGFEQPELAMAAKTWNGKWWALGGGGTVWDHMAYDPELDLLYIGVGNGSPWNRRLRSPGGGDNLFLSSIVALRPATGEYVWHYQVVPAETWDYTATQHMILADIDWQGLPRKVLMQAPKSGFFMVLDRETGELLSAEPFATVTWASHYDLATGRPVELPGQDYASGQAMVRPGSGGAHNWQPMAWHPELELAFIPKMEAPYEYLEPEAFKVRPGWRNQGTERGRPPFGNELLHRYLSQYIATGSLLAWDVKAGQPAWQAPLPTAWNGGVMATGGGLVFQGNGDRRFVAYDAATGDVLWQAETQSPILAAPVSYAIDGEQYITVAAGGGGAFGLMSGLKPPRGAPVSRFLTFKLDGQHQLPPLEPAGAPPTPVLPRAGVEPDLIDRGASLYAEHCAYCHGVGVVSGGTLSDLRWLPDARHDLFSQIVIEGLFEPMGMPRFGDILTPADAAAIQAYVIDKAHTDHAILDAPAWLRPIQESWYRLLAWVIALFVGGSSASA
jgi:PQQ-dependent dehydrogenase (methanol/ethanol family)